MANEKKNSTDENKCLGILKRASLYKIITRSLIFIVVLGACVGGCSYFSKKLNSRAEGLKTMSLVEEVVSKGK